PTPEQEIGDDQSHTDQKDEDILIDVSGLQPDHAVGHVDDASGDAVRAESVDDGAIAGLPEEMPEPLRRPHEGRVIERVEIPGIEQELMGAAEALGEAERHQRIADVEVPSD